MQRRAWMELPQNRFLRGIYLLVQRYLRHNVGMQGAALAFYLLFMIFPLLIFVSSLLGLLQLDVDAILAAVQEFLPREIVSFIGVYLTYVGRNPSVKLLLFGLFCVAGNITLEGDLAGSPRVNVALLLFGTMLSSLVGTTGASMLMVRPLLKMNAWRKRRRHIMVFFIFLISNIGGCLTPIGDPPLLMGFSRGVPFFWSLRLVPMLLLNVAVLLFLFKDRLKTEYEYTFTNGDLDFAQVFNNQKRKALGTMRVKNVEAFGPVDSNEFRKLINMPGINRKNWFLNRGAKLYYFYYQKENNRTIIVLEPSEELVGMIRKYLPPTAWRA